MLKQMKKKKKSKDKEKDALLKVILELKRIYNIEIKYVGDHNSNNTFLWVFCNDFDLVFTICNARGSERCIKLEEIVINEKMRGKGIGTNILEIIKKVCDSDDVKFGFWVKKNNLKLQNYYKSIGFKEMETLDDVWFEYN